jgi:hypothetical protein
MADATVPACTEGPNHRFELSNMSKERLMAVLHFSESGLPERTDDSTLSMLPSISVHAALSIFFSFEAEISQLCSRSSAFAFAEEMSVELISDNIFFFYSDEII